MELRILRIDDDYIAEAEEISAQNTALTIQASCSVSFRLQGKSSSSQLIYDRAAVSRGLQLIP